MKRLRALLVAICAGTMLFTMVDAKAARPSLILTAEGVEAIRQSRQTRQTYSLFEASLEDAKTRVERSIAEGVLVPTPVDPGGGYTHERHKENYKVIHDAGILFQLLGDKRYLRHATDLLLAYAEIYEDLPLHPAQKRQSPGKLFWQNLNESVWLVHVVQGFDAIADALSDKDRATIEDHLLRPVADFLSLQNPETFQKIHNHGTWAAAGVGMTGYALHDPSLVERALLGLTGDGTSGFLAQLDQLFSPDGYYTEGPYYQRYALMPFVLFAQAIDHNEPDRKIFEHRDGVLLKAIDATIQQSYAGKFFPINDAIKEKGLDTQELVYAVAAAFTRTGRNDLLSIADYQGKTVLTGDGLAVARAVSEGAGQSFAFRTMMLRDGPDGDQGSLAILRMGDGPMAQTIVAKNTSQGMGHGHFDKLSYILYDNGREILTDYGAARFLNVPSKDGGRYLLENQSWAKQTIAHNTLVVNESSQFGGDWKRAQKYWPTVRYFEAGERLNVVSASLENAYPDTVIERTVVQLDHLAFAAPLLIDVMSASSQEKTTFDLPFYFDGQIVDFSGALQANTESRKPLGQAHGYQHLWVEATGQPTDGPLRFSWLNARRFYTLHAVAPEKTKPVFVRTGANDPDFNLRDQQGLILRSNGRKAVRFLSVIEPHGIYNPAAEFTAGSDSQIARIDHVFEAGADLIKIEMKTGEIIRLAISNDPDSEKTHRILSAGHEWAWRGFVTVLEEE
ncbi:hypothetical protein JCM17844_21410 [Iodidimonas gelatinilytica]|uniref:Uncharacterized protein n=1 Tax=Iodidimonas gelatinilytica TaxID=1236966 RepID=A0A5A7MS77_9PROT|nr:alginate lyase family protein [Iodidimonas gelatinilytica]GEQ98504.1 hypothetical protein JCM17844_21410 [Iodidimonas gelatinilytica]